MVFNGNNQNEISKEAFGERILSRIILLTGENCQEVFEKLDKALSFGEYLIYLQYHLFLTKKILEERYYIDDVNKIIDSTIIGLVNFSDIIPENKKCELKEMLREWYAETEDYLKDINIYEKQGLYKLVDYFLNDCNIPKDYYSHLNIFLLFSGFIIHHTNDILNDKIILKNCYYKNTAIK